MKLFNKIFLLFAASCFLFVACNDEDDFTPGPTVDGQGFFFSNEMSSSYTLKMTDSSFEIFLGRTFSGTTATAQISSSVTGEDGSDASSLFDVPSTVNFESSSLSASFKVTFDAEEVGYNTYSFVMDIMDETTPYGLSVYEFTVSIEAVWKSLGTGYFRDNLLFEDEYEVEIQQNDYYTDRYRLVTPYDKGLVAEKHSEGTPTVDNKYFTFSVLKSGETLAGVTIADEGLVYYDPYDTGWYFSDEVEEGVEEEVVNGSNVWVEHPADFPNKFDTSVWANNKVVSYADDGTPGVVQLSPYYYLPDYVDENGNIGTGYNHTDDYGCIVITFPSQVPGDYAVSVSYGGKYVDANDNGYVLADVTITGADVASARVALVATESTSAAYDAVVNGTVSYEEVTADGQVMLPYSESGNYTLIVVAYDKKGVAQRYDSVAVKVTSGSVSWVSLGNCEYTDDIFTTFWNNTPVTYEVEIQECDEFPGLYRLVYPYDGKYVHNDPGDWDDTKTYYLEIDATDPDCVWIDKQALGVDWYNYGMMYVWSYAGYYMSEGYAADSEMVSQYYGSLVDGVITFPTDALLFCRGVDYVDGDNVGAFYTANIYGSFKVVLPDAVDKTSVKPAGSSSKKSIDKKAGTGSASLFVPVKFRGNLY